MNKTLAERFWSKVDKNGPRQEHMKTKCWVWRGALRNGYGAIGIGKAVAYAHRIAIKLTTGKDPGPCARHRCDHRPCVRPSHLQSGTKRQNSADMVRRGRSAKGAMHGMRQHPHRVARGERSGSAVLTWKKVQEIRAKYPGSSLSTLAEEYAASVATIHKVVRYETWKI